jgi:hypothetical protein
MNIITNITLALFSSFAIARSEVFSIALVQTTESDKTEFITLLKNGRPERILIDKKRVLVQEDLRMANLNLLSKSILIQLNDEGARKIENATKAMNSGKDRLAFIVGNKLISTAIVRGVLGKNFEITGLEKFTVTDLQQIIAEINQQSQTKIQSLAKPEKNNFEAILFASDSYTKGMSVNEFKNKFGMPSKVYKGKNPEEVVLCYQLDRSDIPLSPDGSAMPDLCNAIFQNDMMIDITYGYSADQKLQNPTIKLPSTLLMTSPKFESVSNGAVAYIEKIKIENIPQNINQKDIIDTLKLLAIVEQASNENDKDSNISNNCDMIKFLSLHVSEIKELVQTSKDGCIPFHAMNAVVQKYLQGKKSIQK